MPPVMGAKGQMRILLVASGYPPNIGGLQTTVEQIAIRLQEAGHTVLVVTNRFPRSLPRRENLNGVAVVRMLFLFPRLQHLRNARPDLFFGGIVFFPITLVRLFLLVRRYKPDVVNIHYLGSPSLFVLALHSMQHCSLVVSIHGGDVDGETLKNRFNRWVFCAMIRRAAVVTSCSDFLAQQAGLIAPALKTKCVVIRNGVNIELFSTAAAHKQDRPYVFCVGQLETHKGFDLAISAFGQLQHDFPDVELLIGGTGSQATALASESLKLGLGSRVKLLGKLDQARIASLMRGSKAVIIPSHHESLGIVALEARSAMATIIASRVGGLLEALDGYPVMWVEPHSVVELRRAIVSLLSGCSTDPPSSAQQSVRRTPVLSWAQTAEMYLKIYKALK